MKANILILGSDNLSKLTTKALKDSKSEHIESVEHITQMPAMSTCIVRGITHLILFSYRVLSSEELSMADSIVELLNLHPSPLPRYAGADPIGAQLLDGVTKSVCTLQTVEEKVDTGRILATAPYYMLAYGLRHEVAEAGAAAILSYLEGQAPTKTKKVTRDSFKVPYGSSFEDILRFRRFCYYHNEAMRLGDLKVWLSGEYMSVSAFDHKESQLGHIRGEIYLSLGNNRGYKVDKLQLPSKKRVSAKDALNTIKNGNPFKLQDWEKYNVIKL